MSAPATALPSKAPLRQVGQVKELLANEQARAQLAAVAASHMTPERMMRLLALAMDKSPDLAKATPMSVLGCLMTCASLGLEPNTALHHAYIIPRKARKNVDGKWVEVVEATLQIGYRGYVQLGHNSGQISGIDAGIHYSDDELWVYRKGAHGVLEHVPGPQQGEKLHAYAVVTLTNGNAIWNVWPWAKILAHRDQYSDAYKNAVKHGKTATTPWVTAEDAMAMKTMIRQLSKFMPMASEVARAASLDGSRANYAAFAMQPAMGLPEPVDAASEAEDVEIEHDPDTGEIVDATPAEAPKQDEATPGPDGKAALAAAKEKAAAAAATAKAPEKSAPAPAETKAAEPLPEPAWLSGFYNELSQWPRDEAALDELKSIYAAQFATVKGTPLYSEIHLEIRRHAAGSDGAADGDDHGAEG